MEVLHALRLSRLNNATLSIVLIVVWVNGNLGARALRHVEVVRDLALELS
jgi:hypothetical protein